MIDRPELEAGSRLEGPCVIEELDTTVLIPPGIPGEVTESGDIVLSVADQGH